MLTGLPPFLRPANEPSQFAADMRIAILTSEAMPFAKTGGLADVSGALPKALNEQDVDAKLILPL